MRYSDIITEGAVPFISPQEAKDRGMFGPVYHGTTGDINSIIANGFSAKHSVPRNGIGRFNRAIGGAGDGGGPSNGYPLEGYGFTGIAAPVHHLGFGSYFTTVKAIAKQFNGDTTKNLKTFYLDIPNTLEINFGSPNTMMRFWRENGYDMTVEATKRGDWRQWVKSTGNLTRTLRNQYDAVHFLGKGIRKLLDGNQIAVYDTSRIYCIDQKLASGLEIGAKVFHTQLVRKYGNQDNQLYVDELRPTDFSTAGKLAGKGWRGIFRAVDHDGNDVPRAGIERNGHFIGNYPIHMIPPPNVPGIIMAARENKMTGKIMYDVKWAHGGLQHNYEQTELRPAVEK